MRVISGSRRRTLLEAPEGYDTRPTQDRIKETLFNMIGPDLYDAKFLDIFAGSGQMGIEALSRGAAFACFVENDKKALACINKNLEKTKFNDSNDSLVLSMDIMSCISTIAKYGPYDFVFMDPPYNKELEKKVLSALADSAIVDEYTTIIVEASLETDFSYLDELGYQMTRAKEYKTNKHIFIKKA